MWACQRKTDISVSLAEADITRFCANYGLPLEKFKRVKGLTIILLSSNRIGMEESRGDYVSRKIALRLEGD